jgi:beta-galactosidase
MKFTTTGSTFKLNGKDFFILSGEVHYFRIPRKLWKRHLEHLKKANCNTVSTYIPWCWHEYEDGKFDFAGYTFPERDLIGFLELCHQMGLYMIVKPGPYILAEYKRNGLPEWLFENYPEVQALDENSRPHPLKMTTYMNPAYLKRVKKWYEHIMPIIRKYQITNNKMIIMMQLCNEIAFYYWFSAKGDYNPSCLNQYYKYLKDNYGKVEKLNKLYDTDYKDFRKVKPPSKEIRNKSDYFKYKDWHSFYHWYYALYLKHLLKLVRNQDIDISVFHNLPGWIDGRALEYPVNVIMYDELEKQSPDIMLGVDHIPEMVDFRNMHDDLICNEVTSAIQNHNRPLMGIEIQAGSRHHKTRVYARELDLFYKACLVHGLKGINFYMFSQGINPPRKGDLGPVFYWQTPLDNSAKSGKLYETISKFGEFIKTHESNIAPMDKKAEIAVGLYRPYYHTEFTIPPFGKRKMNIQSIGLNYDPQAMRDSILFDGIMRSLQVLNEEFRVEDLQNVSLDKLKKYKQLWVMALDCMDEETQRKLSLYIKSGGHLIVLPTFPKMDLNLKKCDYLQRFCKIRDNKSLYPLTPKIDLMEVKDFQCLSRINIYKKDDAKVIARTEAGESCGLTKKAGKGRVSIIGTAFSYELDEHLKAYQALIKTDKISKQVTTDNEDVVAGQRFSKNGSYIYIFNYHKNFQTFKLIIKGLTKGSLLYKFLKNNPINTPPSYGFISPHKQKISKGLSILFTTSELLGFQGDEKMVEIRVAGDKDLRGHLFLETKVKPMKITINNKPIKYTSNLNQLHLEYDHSKKPLSLKIYYR